MKQYEVRLYWVLFLFVLFSYAVGWSTKIETLLVVIAQLLCAILILLARIYNLINKNNNGIKSE